MTFSNETEKLKAQIQELQEKLQKLEEIEKQPRMNLQQEGEYAVVSYHDKVYYRLEGEVTFSWYIKKGVSVGYPVPTLMMVNDAETERLLEGLYYNHIQVKKEKEQRTKKPVEECYKDWWGQYPELETDSQYDDTRWQGFQAGYHFAYEEKVKETAQERGDRIHKEVENEIEKLQEKNWYVAEENEWKTVALLFGKKLPVIPPYGYDELSPNAWYMWVVINYDYYIKQRDIESGRYPTPPQTPEQIEKSLKEAFVKAQQTEEWKETQKLIDEEDNDKNFKNSLDLIKEWGEKNKPLTLYEILMDWWIHHLDMMEQSDERIIDDLVNIIGEKFIPPSNDRNGYEWNKCLELMRGKLR